MNIDAHPNHDRINEKTLRRIVGTIIIRAPSHRTLRLTISHVPEPIPRLPALSVQVVDDRPYARPDKLRYLGPYTSNAPVDMG